MRLAICCVIVFSMIFVYQASAKIDKGNVAGMWLFEEGGGDVTLDSSETGNDGNISGPVKWVNGKFGRGMEFNGNNTWVEVPYDDSLALEELTMVAWGNIDSAKGTRWQSIMMRGQNPRNYLLCIDKDTQKLQISITKGAPDAWAGPLDGPEVTDGQWHHFAGIIGQNAGLVIYLDGLRIGQQAYSAPSLDAAPEVLRIGDGSAGGHQVGGVLDEVAIFNIELEEDDIIDIMDNGLEKVTGLKAPVELKGKLTATWGNIKSK